ncbi:MAG: hypothetical protein KTR14_10935 [Vampirovibrio sp.]|nr:hypothetical protein [Vampirovibrio sp.]
MTKVSQVMNAIASHTPLSSRKKAIESASSKHAYPLEQSVSLQKSGFLLRLEEKLLNNRFMHKFIYKPLNRKFSNSETAYRTLNRYVKGAMIYPAMIVTPVVVGAMFLRQGKREGLSPKERQREALLVMVDSFVDAALFTGFVLGAGRLTRRALNKYGQINELAQKLKLRPDEVIATLENVAGFTAGTLSHFMVRPFLAYSILKNLKETLHLESPKKSSGKSTTVQPYLPIPGLPQPASNSQNASTQTFVPGKLTMTWQTPVMLPAFSPSSDGNPGTIRLTRRPPLHPMPSTFNRPYATPPHRNPYGTIR